MTVPVIETARLRLRGHRADDLDARMALTAEVATMRFIGGGPRGRQENWERLQRYAGHWSLLGHGLFALEWQGRLVGEAGLARFERGMGEDFDGAPEAAWLLGEAAVGRGLAREAMAAAIGWHEARFGRGRMVCLVGPDNAASLRLAAHLGFRPFREARYRDGPVVLLERLPLAGGPAPR